MLLVMLLFSVTFTSLNAQDSDDISIGIPYDIEFTRAKFQFDTYEGLQGFYNWCHNQFFAKGLYNGDEKYIRIVIAFEISKRGKVNRIRFGYPINKKLKRQITRIVRSSPQWVPANKNGVVTKDGYIMPCYITKENVY